MKEEVKTLSVTKSKNNEETGVAVLAENPEQLVKSASKIATELNKIIEKQKLYAEIEKKKFITVEGWNTLGVMLGVFPEVVRLEKKEGRKETMCKVKSWNFAYRKWSFNLVPKALVTEKMEVLAESEVDEIKYEAEVKIKTLSGKTISSAIAICSNFEKGKNDKDEYVIASMAQTRATGKAFRLAFSWIMKMSGYEVTPAEEMEAFGEQNSEAIIPKETKKGAKEKLL